MNELFHRLQSIIENEAGFSDIARGTMLLLIVAAVGIVALVILGAPGAP